jgi:quinol monooxygenase YgiN
MEYMSSAHRMLFEARRSRHDRHIEPVRHRLVGSQGQTRQGSRHEGFHDQGHIDYEAHEVEGQPGVFVIFERWENRAALDGHLHAPRMQELVPELMELMDGTVEDGIRLLQPFRPAR